jgi:hypothetical protein
MPGSAGASHTVIKLGFSFGKEAEDSAGGMIVADADNDGKMDFLVTAPGRLALFANGGGQLWRESVDIVVGGQSKSEGLPGHHGPGVAAADLDGDGRTGVLGATILSAQGQLLVEAASFQGHMDSVFVADVRPDRPGLEVVLLEEGSNHVQLLGLGGVLWRVHYQRQKPQNATLGRFKPGAEEVFVWCRSRYDQHQKPFVFDANGELASHYEMDVVAPADWTKSGVEVIHRIDWTGERQPLACAKERHRRGDVCVFEPRTGRFVERFRTEADRLYVADVAGDWREEILVLSGDELHLYANAAANPRSGEPRLWHDPNYRRLKQYHNYYSP